MTSLTCFDLPLNIPNIDYEQINKLKLLFKDNLLLTNKLKLIKKYDTKQFDTEDSDTDESIRDCLNQARLCEGTKNLNELELDNDEYNINRLIPPYNIPCEYSQTDGCIKKSAFTNSDKYYCWFHINCSN